MKLELANYADGVEGHYCIGRKIKENEIYYEFYNRRFKGEWCSAGEVFIGKEEATRVLIELENEIIQEKYKSYKTSIGAD